MGSPQSRAACERCTREASSRPDTHPDTLALALLAALQGGLLLTQVKRDAKPLEAALDAMIELIARLSRSSS